MLQRRADAALLDSYEEERLPVARNLLRTTDRLFRLLVSDSWWAGVFRTRILARIAARAMKVERVRALAFRSISQIGIRYRGSPLSHALGESNEGAPAAGDRFPWLRLRMSANGPVEDLFEKLDDRCFNLLVFGQPAPRLSALPRADLVRVITIPDDGANADELARARIGRPAFYLLRPDGHIGLQGARLDETELTRYLAKCHIALDVEPSAAMAATQRSRTLESNAAP